MSIGSEIDALGFKGAPAVPASLCLFVQGCRNVTAKGFLPLCLIQNVLKLFPFFFLPPSSSPLERHFKAESRAVDIHHAGSPAQASSLMTSGA